MFEFKPLAGRLLSNAASFGTDCRGTFATTLGVSVLAVALAAGVAVDYTRLAQAKTVMDDALDAAVLAAGAEMSGGNGNETEIRRTFEDFLDANLVNRGALQNGVKITDLAIDTGSGRIAAKTSSNVDMAFMGLAGISSVAIGSDAEAIFSSDSIELAMVLDVTGSMAGPKLNALKNAAKDAVDILLPEQGSNQRLRIGLVPYSSSVNAGSYAYPSTGGLSTRCVTERPGREKHTDAPVRGGLDTVGALTDECPRQKIQPLTNDRKRLLSEISAFRAEGFTAGHIGIAWGYYMLSENWRNLWPTQSDPARYDEKVQKIAIIMTDGEFNTYYDGVSGDPYGTQETASTRSAKAICENMKSTHNRDNGIKVFSVAFQAPASAKKTLSACASPDDGNGPHYFSADNAEELRTAFRSIALNIQKLRLTQ